MSVLMTKEEDEQQSLTSTSLPGVQQKVTWVGCDACGKWRKVSQDFAESLDDDKDWYKLFASRCWPLHRRTLAFDALQNLSSCFDC